jgi:homoserine acetyltransferase
MFRCHRRSADRFDITGAPPADRIKCVASHIKAKTTIIPGESDRLMPPAHCEAFLPRVVSAELVKFLPMVYCGGDASHRSLVESPVL